MRSALKLASASMAASSAIVPQPHNITARHHSVAVNVTLEARGTPGGTIGQISDGQNRIGGNLVPAQFVYQYGSRGGEIIDLHHRGCILTPPTKQFQCDEGVGPTPGFAVDCNRNLLYNNATSFWACPVNDDGVWNVYARPVYDQNKCRPITITVHGDFSVAGCKNQYPRPPSGKAKYFYNSTSVSNKVATSKQSPNGSCGKSTGYNCFGKSDGPCCSLHGWCGLTPLHCGAGCQSEFGDCHSSLNKTQGGKPTIMSKPWTSSGHMQPSSITYTRSSSKTSAHHLAMTNSKAWASSHAKHSSSTSTHPSTSAVKSLAWTPTHVKNPSSTHTQPVPSTTKSAYTLSQDGKCGGSSGFHCNGFGAGSCCSSLGWCGSTPVHCGDGCQSDFGSCKNASSSHGVPSSKTKGNNSLVAFRPKPSSPHIFSNETTPVMDCSKPATDKKFCKGNYPTKGCPHDVTESFVEPYFIGSLDGASPNKTLEKRKVGIINNHTCAIYNFEIGPEHKGLDCSLLWLFPELEGFKSPLYTFDTVSGSSAELEFWYIHRIASEKTTWENMGLRKALTTGPAHPGFSCNVDTVNCRPGKNTFMVCGRHLNLKYFQAAKPNAMGLFIRTCGGRKNTSAEEER